MVLKLRSFVAVDTGRVPKMVSSSVQFIYASRPSTKYFIRNTGTESDGRSCHLRPCPHKFTQNN